VIRVNPEETASSSSTYKTAHALVMANERRSSYSCVWCVASSQEGGYKTLLVTKLVKASWSVSKVGIAAGDTGGGRTNQPRVLVALKKGSR